MKINDYKLRLSSVFYIAHRLTGIGITIFLALHIISITKIASADPSSYDLMIRRMQETDFKLGEIFLFIAIVIHTINGIRLIYIDFLAKKTKNAFLTIFTITIILALVIFGTIKILTYNHVKPLYEEQSLPS